MNDDTRIERIWAMPNRWTFTIKPVSALLAEEVGPGLWCDPFAGRNSPAQVKNDLDPTASAEFHMDALEFLRSRTDGEFDGVLFDPPYSFRQASECYKSFGREKLTATVTSKKYWSDCKDEVARITKPGGKVICFGWTTMGLGKNRGFEMARVLLIPHGGTMNDTLVTVETCHAQPASQEGRVCSKCMLIMASCSVGEITKEEAVEKVRSHGCDVVAEKWAEGKLKIMSCR